MASQLKLSIPHPQVSWALIISQYVRLWLTTFSGVRPCQENRVLCIISDWFFSPPPAGRRTGFFSYLLQEPGQAPEGKSHNIVGLSSCLGPQEFLTLRLAHMEAARFISYGSGFPATTLVAVEISALLTCEPFCPPTHVSGLEKCMLVHSFIQSSQPDEIINPILPMRKLRPVFHS